MCICHKPVNKYIPFFADLMQDIYELPEETKDIVPQVKEVLQM